MSFNNSNKSFDLIGIPPLFFKNKSILNFNQLSTSPKITNLQVFNKMYENRNSVYRNKMYHGMKRNVYIEDNKIHAFKIIESKKRKIIHNESSSSKKLSIEKYSAVSSSDSSNKNSKKLKHLTHENFNKTVDKKIILRDKSFLVTPQLFDESLIDKTANPIHTDQGSEVELVLKTNSKESMEEACESMKRSDKKIHLDTLNPKQAHCNNYQTKSIVQLITEIDSHRRNFSKKKVSDNIMFEKRFENIKNLLSPDVHNKNKDSSASLGNNQSFSSKCWRQLNNDSNSVADKIELTKFEVISNKEDLSKNGQFNVFPKDLNGNVSKVTNVESFNGHSLINNPSVIN